MASEHANGYIVTSDPAGGTRTWSSLSVAIADTEDPTSLTQACPSSLQCVVFDSRGRA